MWRATNLTWKGRCCRVQPEFDWGGMFILIHNDFDFTITWFLHSQANSPSEMPREQCEPSNTCFLGTLSVNMLVCCSESYNISITD